MAKPAESTPWTSRVGLGLAGGHGFRVRTFPYRALRAISSRERFHEVLFCTALDRLHELGAGDARTALAVCGNERDALYLQRHSFDRIVISGFGDHAAAVERVTGGDPRVSYVRENGESLSFASQSFDVVICKEGLHHLARPVAGMYEMLRCCRRAAILIEPFESTLERALEWLGLATCYEREGLGRRAGRKATRAGGSTCVAHVSPHINPFERDNYVFRWTRREIETLLNSYYLDSDYRVDMTVGWLSKRALADRPMPVREVVALGGWMAANVPGLRGNVMTTVILPGKNVPPDAQRARQAFATPISPPAHPAETTPAHS